MAENTIEDQGNESEGGENSGFGEVATRESETQDGAEEQGKSGETEETGSEQGEEEIGEETQTEENKPELTEKGTKKDPNPQSAIHQELANAKRLRTQMETVLGDPNLLSQFIEQQYGIKVPLGTAKTENVDAKNPVTKEYTAKDFENLDDVAKVVNGLQTEFASKLQASEAKVAQLEGAIKGIQSGGRNQQLAQTMQQDITDLSKEPELDPKSPEYVPGLEEKIADRYHKLDFDEKSQTFRGSHTIAEVAHDFLDAVRMGKTRGAQQAQTVVKNKTAGAVRTGTKVKEVTGSEQLKPENSIAQGVSRLFGR